MSVIFVVAVCLPVVLVTAGAGVAADSTSAVEPPRGAVKPVAATGIGSCWDIVY
jgi:hypothetical protein